MARSELIYLGLIFTVLGVAVAGILFGYLRGVGIDAAQSAIISICPLIMGILTMVAGLAGWGKHA